MKNLKRLLLSIIIFLSSTSYAFCGPFSFGGYDPGFEFKAEDISIEDEGEFYDSDNVEDALQEIGTGTVTDPYYIRRDGTNSPTEDIDWDGNSIIGLDDAKFGSGGNVRVDYISDAEVRIYVNNKLFETWLDTGIFTSYTFGNTDNFTFGDGDDFTFGS